MKSAYAIEYIPFCKGWVIFNRSTGNYVMKCPTKAKAIKARQEMERREVLT